MDSLTIFILGGILKLSDLDSLTIFIWGMGILKLLDLDSLTIFILRGGYSETLRFGLPDNFHWGGYSETLGFGLSDNFHLGGGILDFRIGGILSEFGPKCQPLQQAHASQIVSHILRMWRLTSQQKEGEERESLEFMLFGFGGSKPSSSGPF